MASEEAAMADANLRTTVQNAQSLADHCRGGWVVMQKPPPEPPPALYPPDQDGDPRAWASALVIVARRLASERRANGVVVQLAQPEHKRAA